MATSPTLTWDQFQAIPNGTPVFNHGYSECVALFNLFHESVLGLPFVPVQSAYQLWTNFSSYPQLYPYYSKSSSPAVGSVFVSRGGPYNSLDGHVGLVTAVHSNGTFDTMEQNAAHRYVWRYNRGMSGVYGFLHPHNNPATPAPIPNEESKEDEDMAQNAGIFYKGSDGVQHNAVVNTSSGYFGAFDSNVGDYNSGIARAFQTGNFETVSAGHFAVIQAQCAEVRRGK